MALNPKVIDSKKLHLISCLTKAYGYKLRLIIGGECGYEVSIWGNKSIGLSEELLAGGQGYDLEEAIDNCFEDCKDQKNLLASDTCQWIEFHDETELDVTLTLMGHRPDYEPVHLKCIDFNKWEVGPEDGKPIVLVAQPDPSKKDTESIYSKAKRLSENGGLDASLDALAAGMGVDRASLDQMLGGTQVIGVAPGQSMTIGVGAQDDDLDVDNSDDEDDSVDEDECNGSASAVMKVKFLDDIPSCGIKKHEVRDVPINATYKSPHSGETVCWDPDCMDEVSGYVEDAVTIYLRAHGLPASGSMAGEFFYGSDDDCEDYYTASALAEAPDSDWGNSSYYASQGSVYDEVNRTVDHSMNKDITHQKFCVLNILDVIDNLC